MTAQTPERDTRAETLAQVAYDAAHKWDNGTGDPILLQPWGELNEFERDCWRQVALAVAAHVANPAAEDFDAAAEIMRLRDLLARVRADLGWIWRESVDENARARADQALTALKEAGIE